MHSSLAAFSSVQTQQGYTRIFVNDGLSTELFEAGEPYLDFRRDISDGFEVVRQIASGCGCYRVS